MSKSVLNRWNQGGDAPQEDNAPRRSVNAGAGGGGNSVLNRWKNAEAGNGKLEPPPEEPPKPKPAPTPAKPAPAPAKAAPKVEEKKAAPVPAKVEAPKVEEKKEKEPYRPVRHLTYRSS